MKLYRKERRVKNNNSLAIIELGGGRGELLFVFFTYFMLKLSSKLRDFIKLLPFGNLYNP